MAAHVWPNVHDAAIHIQTPGISGEAALTSLTNGITVEAYLPGQDSGIQLTFFYDHDRQGFLYWSVGTTKIKHEPNRVAIHEIISIATGKTTDIFLTEGGRGADEKNCITLITPDIQLNLETHSASTIVTAIDHAQNVEANRQLTFLHRGINLTRFVGLDNGTVAASPVHAFYKYDNSRGVVYICDAGTRVFEPPGLLDSIHCINVTDIEAKGISSSFWQAHAADAATVADESTLFSIIGRDGHAIHLAAESKSVRDQLLTSLAAVVSDFRPQKPVAAPTTAAAAPFVFGRQASTSAGPTTFGGQQPAHGTLKLFGRQGSSSTLTKDSPAVPTPTPASAAAVDDESVRRIAAAATLTELKQKDTDSSAAAPKAAVDDKASVASAAVAPVTNDTDNDEAAKLARLMAFYTEKAKQDRAAADDLKQQLSTKREPMLYRQPSSSGLPYVTAATANIPGGAPAQHAKSGAAGTPLAAIEQGAEFTTFFESTPGNVSSRKLFFFFEVIDGPVMGAIYWCEPGQRNKKDDNRLPFARISDVFMGKQTPILQSERAKPSNPKCCFSLMAGKSWGLHLEAESEAVRATWLAGIRAVFQNSGKPVTDGKGGNSSSSAAASSSSSSSSSATPALAVTATPTAASVPAKSSIDPMDAFLKGRDFIWYAGETEGKVGSGSVHNVSVFYLADAPGMEQVPFGRLFVTERGLRTLVNPLRLDQLKNVYVGKHTNKTKLWTQEHTRPAQNQSVVTLEFKSGQVVGLEGVTPIDAQLLTQFLQQLFAKPRPAIPPTPAPSEPVPTPTPLVTPAPAPAAVAAPASSPSNSEESFEKDIAVISQGLVFTAYLENDQSLPVTVFYDRNGKADAKQGSLYWCEPNTRVKVNGFPLAEISDVFLEKQTAIFQAESAISADAARCFSIIAKNNQLNLEAQSPQLRDQWLAGLHRILVAAGKKVVEEDPAATEEQLRDAIAKLTAGHTFTVWTGGTPTTPATSQQLFFFYHVDASSGVWLYWCTAGSREVKQENGVSLPRISDLFIGKQTQTFKSQPCTEIDEKLCFTIISGPQELNLQAESGPEREAWLAALHRVLVSSGKKVVEDDDTKTPKTTTTVVTSQTSATGGELYDFVARGARFTGYFQGENGVITGRSIFIFYEVDPTAKLGSLYWCDYDDGKRTIIDAHRMPLNRISDVFLGKQTDLFQSQLAPVASALPERCLSVATKKIQLNLEAESPVYRDRWLAGFKSIFTSSGKKVVDDSVADAPSPSTVAIPPVTHQPTAEERESYIRQMEAGDDFRAFFSQGSPPVVSPFGIHLFYDRNDGRMGTLYYCERGKPKTKSADHSVPLHLVSDMFLGKKDPIWNAPATINIDPRQCFSVKAANAQLHLAAPSEKTRNQWLLALHDVIVRHKASKTVTSESSAASPATAISVSHTNGNGVYVQQSSSQINGNIAAGASSPSSQAFTDAEMKAGHEFESWSMGVGNQGVHQPIFIFYRVDDDHKLGSFYWCDPNDARASPAKPIPAENVLHLASVTDMYLGKQQEVFKTEQAMHVPPNLCCSVCSEKAVLHLQAATPEKRDAWLFGLTGLLKQYAQKVKDQKAAIALANGEVVAPAPAPAAAAGLDRRTMMQRHRFTGFFGNPAHTVRSQPIDVVFREDDSLGSLYWASPGADFVAGDRLHLDRISDLFLGKQTRTLQHEHAILVDADRCCSVVESVDGVESAGLHLCAESSEKRDAWLFGLQNLLTASGKTVVDKDKADELLANGNNADYLNTPTLGAPADVLRQMASRRATILSLPTDSTYRMMSNGRKFYQHSGDGRRREIHLFYQKLRVDHPLGALYWYEASSASKQPEGFIPLHTVTDVFLGKQTRAFDSFVGNAASEERTFSVIGSHAELNLEAESTDQVAAWLFGINRLLTSSGKEIVLEDDKSLPSSPRIESKAPLNGGDAASPRPNHRRRFSVATQGSAASARHTYLALGNDQTEHMMTRGQVFTLYTYESPALGVTRKDVRVRYVAGTHALEWSVDGSPVPSGRIPVDAIVEIFIGRQSVALKAAKGAVDASKCVTLTTRNASLNLEAQSEEQLSAWLLGLSKLLTDGFKKRTLLPNEEGTRYQIVAAVAVATVPAEDKKATGLAGRYRFVHTAVPHPVGGHVAEQLRRLADGYPVTIFDEYGQVPCRVWYSNTPVIKNQLGSLQWRRIDATPNDASAQTTIAAGEIELVAVGQPARGLGAHPDRFVAFTLDGQDHAAVQFEFASHDDRDHFLLALNTVVCATGAHVGPDDQLSHFLNKARSATPAASSSSANGTNGVALAISVTPATQSQASTPSHATAHGPPAGLSIAVATPAQTPAQSPAPSPRPELKGESVHKTKLPLTGTAQRMLERGQLFRSHSRKGKRNIIKDILLWWSDKEPDSNPGGALFWCDPAIGKVAALDRSVSIDEITDVIQGKHSPILDVTAKDMDPDKFFTVQAGVDGKRTLDLEAAQPEQVLAWTMALASLSQTFKAKK